MTPDDKGATVATDERSPERTPEEEAAGGEPETAAVSESSNRSVRDRLAVLVRWCGEFVRARRRLLLVAVVVAAVVAVGAVALVRFTGLPEGAAFRVGDQVVSEQELDRRVDLLGALYGIRPPTDEAGQEAFRRDSAKAIAVSTVLDQAADERGIVVSEKVARDALAKTVEQQTGSFDRASYTRLLAEVGASEADVLAEITRQQRTAELFRQVAGPAAGRVTDADVRAHYDQHPDQMVAPEQRHLRNVVVATEAEAVALAARARAGEDFAVIAEQSTLDQSTRAARGDLGFVGRTQLEQEFGDAAFAAGQGAVFGPVRSAHGWNLGQVLEVRPATPMSYEQVQQSLGDRLRSERGLTAWRDWMGEQVEHADVTYASAFRPDDPSALTAPPGTPPPGPDGAGQDQAAPSGGDQPGVAEIAALGAAAVIGVGFVVLGHWGRGNAESLAPSSLLANKRTRKVRSLRRGGLTCMIGGTVLAVLAAVGVVTLLA